MLLLSSTVCSVLIFHNTPTELTPSDASTFKIFLTGLDILHRTDFGPFANEIAQIKIIQGLIQNRIKPIGGIPKGQPRQPANVLAAGHGLCYDRAYTLAKLYRYLGWKTRHVALYQNDPDRFDLMELLSKEIRSHASLEVKTQRGWLIIDPDKPWIGLATDSLPHGYFEVQNQSTPINWLEPPPVSLAWHLSESPIVVYGLYSRHGRFFPPYNAVPDVNWGEMWYNL